ncbi:hypothetical protein [Sphingobacterium tabacisoli]|uniref:Uncharacterized protein n=1 Tax=Sphingobacterium tabacisoli TaxID=2044855 RepID=A0ABW5L821_9SPHI|nr:hypothetical protein [Sphingobacterium tabacisoli]
MLQRIGSIGLALHLGLVFLHNICNIQPPSTDVKSALDPITHTMQKLCSAPGFRHYGQLAGIHGCYGFYSPQVGSIYSSRIEVRCARTATELRLSSPGLRTTASKIRYCTLLEALEGWRSGVDQTKAPALARATAQSIYNHVQRQYPDRAIRLRIYSIRIPSLSELRTKKQTNKMITPIYEQPTQQKHPLCNSAHFW